MMKNKKIAIIGLGYVGLPLAVEFGKSREVFGYDIDTKRVEELQRNIDATLEVTSKELKSLKNTTFTDKLSDIKDCTIYIVTVPTPTDKHNRPVLTPMIKASETIANFLKRQMIELKLIH